LISILVLAWNNAKSNDNDDDGGRMNEQQKEMNLSMKKANKRMNVLAVVQLCHGGGEMVLLLSKRFEGFPRWTTEK